MNSLQNIDKQMGGTICGFCEGEGKCTVHFALDSAENIYETCPICGGRGYHSKSKGGNEMKAKHTPGPWRIKAGPIEGMFPYKIQAPDGNDQAPWTVAYTLSVYDGETDVANAALIAAAPRIKIALEGLLVAVNDSLVRAEPKVIAAMREARVAIEEAAK